MPLRRYRAWRAPSGPSGGSNAPVVHFDLSTGASCDNDLPLLEHLASHGFLAVCNESPSAGRIQHCMDALETAYRLHPQLAAGRIGLGGHHTGGADAISCLARAEQQWGDTKRYAVHATLPASGVGDTDGEPGLRASARCARRCCCSAAPKTRWSPRAATPKQQQNPRDCAP